jgi:MoxR-like ATPase
VPVSELTSPEAVDQALVEFDELGRDAFLAKYRFGRAKRWFLERDGRLYDSKAIFGVAVGYQHPERGTMWNNEFSGGEGSIKTRLEDLGFTMVDRPEGETSSQRVWIIRAGLRGEEEDLARAHGVAVIGWSELGELGPSLSRDELKTLMATRSNEAPLTENSVANQAGQIYRFIHDVSEGDLVVLPLKTQRNHVAVGRITGPYAWRTDGEFADSDGKNTRPTEWLATSLPYDRFDAELREKFGQRVTVSELDVEDVVSRILDVVGGADASAIHLVLKWSPSIEAKTIEYHREVADRDGAVWWGRVSKPGTTGLAADRIDRIRQQLQQGSLTNVYLHSGASTWRTRLLAITTDPSEIEETLVPDYYEPETHHSLWVKLTDFERTEPSELTEGFVLAQSGEPVTLGGLGNQGPLVIRKLSAVMPGRYFILNQVAAEDSSYEEDVEGIAYHWTDRSSGAWKQLANSSGARFIYYRPGSASDGTSQTYFGSGQIDSVGAEGRADGRQHFIASIEDFQPFDTPVPWKEGPNRNAQTSIQPITQAQYKKLYAAGMNAPAAPLDADAVRAAAEARGLNLDETIYAQVVAALVSGKHLILTGPPGTAKTTLAQTIAEAASAAAFCSGYTLTTATADWTTFETIGGLRPTADGELHFQEGHFLTAIRRNEWLVIDELNRSNFDRAFGQLFTVLSGQPVVLPYERPDTPGQLLTLVPEGKEPPMSDADVLAIPQSWRIVATMNVFDKTLLFEMSYALMRRFAFVEVASPSQAVFEALIDRESGGETESAAIAKSLLVLRKLKDLGPAVFMDLTRYIRERQASAEVEDGQLIFEAFYSYLLPQFEGIDDDTGVELNKTLGKLVGTSRRKRLRETLNTVLGLELQAPTQAASPGLSEDEILEETADADDEEPIS